MSGIWAYPVGGVAEKISMGSLTSIGYTIPYSPGTLVSFAVLDSTGKSAGTSYLYTIQPSNNTACLSASKATTPALSMYVNATSLEACGQLGVGFQGGTEPYSLSISAINTYLDATISLGSGNAGYVFVNTLPIGTRFTITGQDSAGNLAITSQIIASVGTNMTACNQVSTPQKDAILGVNTSGVSGGKASGGSSTAAIIGATVGCVIAAILIGALVYVFLKKRRRRQDRRISGVSIEPFKDDYANQAHGTSSPSNPSMTASSPVRPGFSDLHYQSHSQSPSLSQRQPVMSERYSPSWTAPYFADFGANESLPLSPATAYGGGLSAGMIQADQDYSDETHGTRPAFYIMNPDEGRPQTPTTEQPSSPRRPLPTAPNNEVSSAPQQDAGAALAAKTGSMHPRPDPELVQHTDAGPAGPSGSQQETLEVPPPYIRRYL
ncbi:MAG: hypothetical protein CYPHOPRED_002822 [Cyphobasidiales sp. Tagirdzhanova-0007]|nr:MAG: hypothetical protein CYPHOPRED_002822 [Cyphobasidiales sp. Tagirdzhanova-0007]